MAFTVADLHDLIVLLEEQPAWKAELRPVLLGEELLRLPEIVRELAESMRPIPDRLERMEERQDRMELDIRELRQDVSKLKGSDKERFYRERAAAVFGRWLDKGRDATDPVARRLREAAKAGQLTPEEQDAVLEADLLWLGDYEGREILVVGEASWKIDAGDVRRAADRAAVVRRLGFDALAFVGGVEWVDEADALAQELQVISSRDGKIDREMMNRLLGNL